MALLDFDATDIPPAEPRELLPPGHYVAEIIESEMKPTAAGTGHFLALTFEITEGPSAKRRLWANLNLDNPNSTAVEIARKDLSAICHAIGKLAVRDSAELHFKPMTLVVEVGEPRVDKRTGKTYPPSNQIKGYQPVGGPAAPARAAPQQQAAAAKPAATTAAPWRRAG